MKKRNMINMNKKIKKENNSEKSYKRKNDDILKKIEYKIRIF